MSTAAALHLPQHAGLRSMGCVVGVDRVIACAARRLGATDTLALLDGDIAPLRRANLFSEGALLVAADMDRLHLSALDSFADWLEYEVENEDKTAAGRSGLLILGGSAPWDVPSCAALRPYADRVFVAQPVAASVNDSRVRTLGFHLFEFPYAAFPQLLGTDRFTAADIEATEALEFTLVTGAVAVVRLRSSPRTELSRMQQLWANEPRTNNNFRFRWAPSDEDDGGNADASPSVESKQGVHLVVDAPAKAIAFVRDALEHSGFVTSFEERGDSVGVVTVRLHSLPSLLLLPSSCPPKAAVLPCARGAVLRLRLLVDALSRLEAVQPSVHAGLVAGQSHLEAPKSDVSDAIDSGHIRLCTVLLRAPGVLAADDHNALRAYGHETRDRFLQHLREEATSAVCSGVDFVVGSVAATRAIHAHLILPASAGAAGMLHVVAAAGVIVATFRAAVAWAWDVSPTVLASTEERVAAAVAATRKRLAQSDARQEAAAAAAAGGSWWEYVGLGGGDAAAGEEGEDVELDTVDDEDDGIVEAVTFSLDGVAPDP